MTSFLFLGDLRGLPAGTHVQFVVIMEADTGLEIWSSSTSLLTGNHIGNLSAGMTATAGDAQEVCGAIRKTLVSL